MATEISGMLWMDKDMTVTFKTRLQKAVDYFVKKYHCQPVACWIRTTDGISLEGIDIPVKVLRGMMMKDMILEFPKNYKEFQEP